MSKLWIREHRFLGVAPIFGEPTRAPCGVFVGQEPGIDQAFTFSTSTQSAAFADTTRFICIVADVSYHYVVGDDPTATTDAFLIPALLPVYVGVEPGQKLAVIAAA
jgi:hypothetical protein